MTSEGESKVRARQNVPEGLSWGPYQGNIHSEPASPGNSEPVSKPNPPVTLVLEDDNCWLLKLPLVSGEGNTNSVIYKKDDSIWCKTTKAISEGDALSAFVMAEPMGIPNHTVKTEPEGPSYPAALAPEIQLLPQQAGMAAILATAVVNKDVFPCKDCGIWYRSERNLQAHLMYYCASRQNATSPTVDEKPKEAYPNERICPFPQCKKSCPSASSLEIHMRSHSGERPFVCLICHSAFTTKANCERHLKVHTDTLNGVCHSCGFISTTRDILYSHLVTNHMICQPGSKGEVYAQSTTIAAPATKPLAPGKSGTLQQHVVLHSTAAAVLPGLEPKAAQSQLDTPAKLATQGVMAPPTEEAANGSPPQEGFSSTLGDGVTVVQIKEEPEDEGELEPDASSRASSPHSLHSVKVKSEITSPTPGSSPVPSEPGSSTPGGTIFLPQYMFGHEATVVPQASEILAKMSELVHSRLKQGHTVVPPVLFPGTPVPKGATCFECEITFNNINNYYVHKRLYCSSRRLAEESPPGPRKLKAAPSVPPKGPPTPGVLLSPPLPGDSKATIEGEADGTGRISEDSRSPGGSSMEEPDDDPSRTVCEACNIRFSRHETYMVHKRYYCASRHDPPLRRAGAAGKVPFLPQPIRTRKRRKLYEIHNAANQLSGAPDATHPEVPPVVPALIPVVKAAPSPSSSPDTDGPIDLSKKPRLHSGAEVLPASLLPLADYHECTACRISFHSLDSYLAHKKYYCPATPLQPTPPAVPLVVCPYCPLNGAIKGDLVEHFRNAHGLFVAKTVAGATLIEATRTLAEGSLLPPLPTASPPQPLPRLRKDSFNGKEPPTPSATPNAPPGYTDKSMQTPLGKGPPTPVANGNHRYCRLCNIKFSSLSTFIAHKKYYCSSHAAEHVK
uniref:Zinc finger protein, FOG family member 1 n=1 Tax=Podarcis muralis TaxID=64176 RepID=A0A670IST1_PODMU